MRITSYNKSAKKIFHLNESNKGQSIYQFLKKFFLYLDEINFSKIRHDNCKLHILEPRPDKLSDKYGLLLLPSSNQSKKPYKTFAILLKSPISDRKTTVKKRHLHYLQLINKISSKSYKYNKIDQLSKFVLSELYNEEYQFFHVAIFLRENSFRGDHVKMVGIAGDSEKVFRDLHKNGYRQTLSLGVIGKVIAERKSMVINNTQQVKFYHSTPYFQGKSELCVPIFILDQVVGVINIETKHLTNFDDADVAFLESISDIYAANLYRIITNQEISEKNDQLQKSLKNLENAKEKLELQSEELRNSLKIGKQVQIDIEKQNEMMLNKLKMGADLQKSLLPRQFPSIEGVNFSSKYLPTLQLGGDYFDVVQIDDQYVGIIIADVSGHGVSAAMIAAMFKALFSNYKKYYLYPKDLLKIMNSEFCRMINTGDFITAFYLLLDRYESKITYINAGHPFPLLFRSESNKVIELDSPGFFLGVFEKSSYKENHMKLKSGDKILFYTDGATEVRNSEEKLFGKARLKKISFDLSNKAYQGKEFIATIFKEIALYSDGKPYEDDITLLLTEIN
jgi:serine phosphatase RsbU (regulator of sigma subunit)